MSASGLFITAGWADETHISCSEPPLLVTWCRFLVRPLGGGVCPRVSQLLSDLCGPAGRHAGFIFVPFLRYIELYRRSFSTPPDRDARGRAPTRGARLSAPQRAEE